MVGYTGLSIERLLNLFQDSLEKEDRYRPNLSNLTSKQGEDAIGLGHRDNSVAVLLQLHHHFGFHPETFALSINLLDRFLSKVKVNARYLACVSVSCYFLATKMLEEDEIVPTASDMVEVSRCGCSPADLLRMERIILDKLGWDLHGPTALDFLQVLHALCVARGYLDACHASFHLHQTTMHLEVLLCHHKFSSYKPSVLALGLLSCDLSFITRHWLQAVVEIVELTEIEDWELSKCRNNIMDYIDHLHTSHFSPSGMVKKRSNSEDSQDDEDEAPDSEGDTYSEGDTSEEEAGCKEMPEIYTMKTTGVL